MGEDGKRCLLELELADSWTGGKMGEDVCWTGTRNGGRCLLELADSWTGGRMGEDACWSWWRLMDGREDGRRCLLELVETAGRAGGWMKMPAGAGRQLNGREEMEEDACWSW